MTRLDGVKEVALARARIQVTKIQALLKEINEFTSQLLVSASLVPSDLVSVSFSGIRSSHLLSHVDIMCTLSKTRMRITNHIFQVHISLAFVLS
jgi:hypothetical protein